MNMGMTMSAQQLSTILQLDFGSSLHATIILHMCSGLSANTSPIAPELLQALVQSKHQHTAPRHTGQGDDLRSDCGLSCICQEPLHKLQLFNQAAPNFLVKEHLLKSAVFGFNWLDERGNVRKLRLTVGEIPAFSLLMAATHIVCLRSHS